MKVMRLQFTAFHVLVFILTFTGLESQTVLAGDPLACDSSSKFESWADMCKSISETYRKSGMPDKMIDAKCSDPYYLTKNDSTRCLVYRASFDQLHALVAEAFYSKRLDHRKQALLTLIHYNCENDEKCRIFKELMDLQVKNHVLVWRKVYPELWELVNEVQSVGLSTSQ
jgi:hypothetical protein